MRKNITILQIEKVQRRTLRSINGLRHLGYDERLHRAGFSDLVTRRTRGDLIQQFKLSHGAEQINWPFFDNTPSKNLKY
ncbi:RNA-directed DNA polymerase from mobile element jockey-like [Brachionus plicatilis]|uniref:RNA-directed DNA polymerase from mobile element jockey-like n=1 Tax=Brachionus plicatilis TaxID=10195 RepID=A0A3M7SL16_BRAPC|nr:RNA-directed DNA polymerase from mobile element jockey-like [Brachionus plicatilis]